MDMINSQLIPPGFRFYPTDEELVGYYLKKKVDSKRIDLNVIKDVDLYKIEPWDLQELCQISAEEQTEWHFFSHKDKKYPTGTRTNRATKTGFWKATGRDKPIFLKHNLIGMRKTLVYYVGRAPNGQKTDWIMHEYRLETNEYGIPQEEGWVVCKAFKKRVPALRKHDQHADPSQYLFDDKLFNLIPEFDLHSSKPNNDNYTFIDHYPFERENIVDQMLSSDVTDWRELDKFVASQLSHDDTHFSNASASAINLAMNM